jgi:two-component system chemotaxis response regulator CheB
MARIIAIGASQGGVQALRTLVAGLPPDFSAPVLVVQHIGATESILPSLLNDVGALEAAFAVHREPLAAGRIYVAPPDHHMLVSDGRVELTRGPRENWARPAVDPLFRSIAHHYGPDGIGIVLSGRLNDGTSGLYELKRQGGIALVQTPSEAEAPDMPQSALENVSVDYCLPVAEMPRLLLRLAAETSRVTIPFFARDRAMEQEQKLSQPSAQTCPECGGAMREEKQGGLTRFRCHIGHVMTAEVLAATQLEELENAISSVVRTLNERRALCLDLADKQESKGNLRAAEMWRHAAEEAERREMAAQQLAGAEWVHPEAVAEAGE